MERPDTDLLTASLERAAAPFAPDELAYLALTSKIERPLQDRLAWSLHTQLPELVVAREWRRADIAVLDASATAPLVLIEAKAMYTNDVMEERSPNTRKYMKYMRDDIAKSVQLDAGGTADVYALALATHPMGAPRQLDGVIKYLPAIRGSLQKNSHGAVRQSASETLSRLLPDLGPVRSGSLMGGSAFGVQVAIDWWLVGPAPR
jgi:hypothetical protein